MAEFYTGHASIEAVETGVRRVTGKVTNTGRFASRKDGIDAELPLVPGAALEGGTLWIFDEAEGVTFEAGARHLQLVGTHGGRALTLVLKVDPKLKVQAFGRKEILPERVVRFVGAEKTLVADNPVRPGWARVATAELLGGQPTAGSTADVVWTIQLPGNLSIQHRVSPVVEAMWKDVGSKEQPAALAIWPPAPPPDWRYRVVLVGADSVGDFKLLGLADATLSWGDANGTTLAADQQLQMGGLFGLELRAGQAAAFLSLSFDKADAAGTFRLVSDGGPTAVALDPGAVILAVDFGTSTTVVAARGNTIDFHQPRLTPGIIVANKRGGALGTDLPWIPMVPSSVHTPVGVLVEIPTGVLVRDPHAVDREPREVSAPYPLLRSAPCGSALNHADPLVESRWKADLKWGPRVELRKAFLLNVLILAAAAHPAKNYKIRATYPLAQTGAEQTAFSQALEAAVARLTVLTGRQVELEAGRALFCDEARALLHGANTEMDDTHVKEPRRVVVRADLGGGTLDLALAALHGRDAYHVIAADSVRCGAQLIIDCLAKELTDPKQRGAVENFVRLGRLDTSMRLWLGDARRAALSTLGDPDDHLDQYRRVTLGRAAGEVAVTLRERAHVYGAMLLEHVARFVAGTLLDKEAWAFRCERGPGLGNPVTTPPEGDARVVLTLSGNGWKALHKDISGWGLEAWKVRLAERIAVLVGTKPSVTLRQKAEDAKTITALNALKLLFGEAHTREAAPARAAPDGLHETKHDGTVGKWRVQTGPGANPKTAMPGAPTWAGDMEVALAEFENAVASHMQFKEPESIWRAAVGATILAPLQLRIQTLQGDAHRAAAVSHRVVPTLTALWEVEPGARVWISG